MQSVREMKTRISQYYNCFVILYFTKVSFSYYDFSFFDILQIFDLVFNPWYSTHVKRHCYIVIINKCDKWGEIPTYIYVANYLSLLMLFIFQK